MERLIEQKLKKPLSKEILFGKLTNGGRVNVDCINGEITVTVLDTVAEVLMS